MSQIRPVYWKALVTAAVELARKTQDPYRGLPWFSGPIFDCLKGHERFQLRRTHPWRLSQVLRELRWPSYDRRLSEIEQPDNSKSRTAKMHNKRLEALRSNPDGNWIPADFEITASQYAIKFRKVTGTHVVFLHPSVPNCVAIPMKKKIRPIHVRAFVEMVDRMDALDR